MKCPICSNKITIVHIDGENYEACPSCEGLWLHKHQLNVLLKEINGDPELCSLDNKPHSDDHPPIKCINCDKMMKKVNFLEFSDIVMDYCSQCGSFWLDKGELYNMHKYIKKIENGTKKVNNLTVFNLLKKINEISYSIFSF